MDFYRNFPAERTSTVKIRNCLLRGVRAIAQRLSRICLPTSDNIPSTLHLLFSIHQYLSGKGEGGRGGGLHNEHAPLMRFF